MTPSMQDPILPESHFTPLRSAGQYYAATRVDTEGRRSRFHSPPPPPGASPSLLLPTPRRYANDIDLMGNLSGDDIIGNAIEAVESEMSPLKNPIFGLEPGLSSSNKDGDDMKRLCQWSIKFKPCGNIALPSNEHTSHLSHWIIIAGVRIRNGKKEPWRSSLVHLRKTPTHFETASGNAYELVGPCDLDVTCKKTSADFAARFKDGLPEDWVKVVAKEARRLQFVQFSEEMQRCLPDWPIDIHGKKKPRKQRALSPPDSFILPLSRRASEVSVSLSQSDSSQGRPRKKPHTSQTDSYTSKELSKSIPRELRQLQTSKLGNLALVEAAILEGMTPERQASKEKRKPKSGNAEKEPSHVVKGLDQNPEKAVKKECHAAKTPLRSSNRARNGAREWWKVSSKSASQADVTDARPAQSGQAEDGKSPGRQLSGSNGQTDVSDSGEDFKCASSSEDEENSLEMVEIKAVPKKYTRKGRTSIKANTREKVDEIVKIAEEIAVDDEEPLATPDLLVMPQLSAQNEGIEEDKLFTGDDILMTVESNLNEEALAPTPASEGNHQDGTPNYLVETREEPVETQELELKEDNVPSLIVKTFPPTEDKLHSIPSEVLFIDQLDDQDDREDSFFYFSD